VQLCFYIINTAEVGVVEQGGKFRRLAQPGLGCVCYPFEQLVGKLSFRVQQLNVTVETKTLDNVFVTAMVSVQFQVLREKVYEAFYALSNPTQQITAHVYDVMRSELPKLDLDSAFEAKEELALAVKAALRDTMTGYGYQILQGEAHQQIYLISQLFHLLLCFLLPTIFSSFFFVSFPPPPLCLDNRLGS
jgi:regulator of protease activity HflC (stomatin/prohibitin superfamily)